MSFYPRCSVCGNNNIPSHSCTFCDTVICDFCIIIQGRKSEKIIFESGREARYVVFAPADHGNCELSKKNKKKILDADVGDNICNDAKSIILQYL